MLKKDLIAIAQDMIRNNPLATICTVDKTGELWGAAVYMGCDDEFNLYFTTKSHTIKHTHLTDNPHVAVVFASERKQETIQLRGEATLVSGNKEANTAATALTHAANKSLDWTPPLSKLKAGRYKLYKITVSYARISSFGDRRVGERPAIAEYKSEA